MEEIIKLIKDKISECKNEGEMFSLPYINIPGVTVVEEEGNTSGSVLVATHYRITLPDGNTIGINYQSKDKCRTFQVNPDRSYIQVTCSDSKFDFSDAWDENN